VHLVRAAHERGIGVVPALQYPRSWAGNRAAWRQAREYVADLVDTIGNGRAPGLAFWGAHNEPGKACLEFARYMAGVFRELDTITPVIVGNTFESEMEELGADAVDVLCFHDYSPNRAQIRSNLEHAKAFAAKSGKQVINGEIGCIAAPILTT
jgi:hypothetical protein